MLQFMVNGERHTLDIDPETPLLWVLRERLNLAGTKYVIPYRIVFCLADIGASGPVGQQTASKTSDLRMQSGQPARGKSPPGLETPPPNRNCPASCFAGKGIS